MPLVNDEPMEGMTKYFLKRDYPIMVEGKQVSLTYFLRKPDQMEADKKYPLVLVLHDEKGVAQAAEYLLMQNIRTANPAFVVVPVLPPKRIWAFPEEYEEDKALQAYTTMKQGLSDAVELITGLQDELPIDPDRIYVVGCSIGGWGVFGASLEHHDVFAAGIAVNGGWAVKEATKLNRMPIYVLHGQDNKKFKLGPTQDLAFWIQKNMKNPGDIRFFAYPGAGGECNNPAYYGAGIFAWMFKHHK
jgi:predicted peptidase